MSVVTPDGAEVTLSTTTTTTSDGCGDRVSNNDEEEEDENDHSSSSGSSIVPNFDSCGTFRTADCEAQTVFYKNRPDATSLLHHLADRDLVYRTSLPSDIDRRDRSLPFDPSHLRPPTGFHHSELIRWPLPTAESPANTDYSEKQLSPISILIRVASTDSETFAATQSTVDSTDDVKPKGTFQKQLNAIPMGEDGVDDECEVDRKPAQCQVPEMTSEKPIDFSIKKRKSTQIDADLKRTNLNLACGIELVSSSIGASAPLISPISPAPRTIVSSKEISAAPIWKVNHPCSDASDCSAGTIPSTVTDPSSNEMLKSFLLSTAPAATTSTSTISSQPYWSAFETVKSSASTGSARDRENLQHLGALTNGCGANLHSLLMASAASSSFVTSSTGLSSLNFLQPGLASENTPRPSSAFSKSAKASANLLSPFLPQVSLVSPETVVQSSEQPGANSCDANFLTQSVNGKLPRPFKTYNPSDPASALQFGYLSGFSPFMPAGSLGYSGAFSPTVPKQIGHSKPVLGQAQAEQLMSHYRQLFSLQHQRNRAVPLISHPVSSTSSRSSVDPAEIHSVQRNGLSNGNHALLSGRLSEPIRRRPSGCPSSSTDIVRKTNSEVGNSNGLGTHQDSHIGASTPSPPQVTSTTCSNPSSSPENHGQSPSAHSPVPLPIHVPTPLSVNAEANTMRPQSNSSTNGLPASNIPNGIDEKRASLSSNSSGSESSVPSSTVQARRRGRSLPEDMKDDQYWERRRKNNEAAKRSRDARRVKEDEIAIRAALLEQENLKLRIEVTALKNDIEKLRQLLLNT